MTAEQQANWDFHGLAVTGQWDDDALGQRWRESFASRPAASTPAGVTLRLALADSPPPAPPGAPDFHQGDLLAYYLDCAAFDGAVVAHFPRFGQLRLRLNDGQTEGALAPAALAAQGAFEDLLAIGLSPHLRRRGMFLLHALAAAPPGGGRAALLVGGIGAGKTTTGLALLAAGWKLLSNDSPMLAQGEAGQVRVLAYPGLLSAYPESLARFEALAHLHHLPAAGPRPDAERRKVLFAAESVWPDAWTNEAAPGAILFPRIEDRADHALEPIAPPEALRQILPHAIEQWDRPMIAAHLRLLNALVQSVPAYCLRLGPDVAALPAVVAKAVGARP